MEIILSHESQFVKVGATLNGSHPMVTEWVRLGGG